MYFKNLSEITQEEVDTFRLSKCYFLVFVAEKSASEVPDLINLFRNSRIKIFGGIFPTIIQDTTNHFDGILVIKMPYVRDVIKFSAKDESTFKTINSLDGINSAILLIDAMIPETDSLLRRIYGLLNNKINIFGGGAGFLTLQQKPCLFTEEGIFEDGAVLALLEKESKIGVKHGWEVFAGPFIANSTEKNIIKELNWRPAFEVYKEVIEANSDNVFSDTNFFEIAKTFPFGIRKEGLEYIVRDPFTTNEAGELVCISEIPENSMLQILTGDPEKLIAAAKEVANETFNSQNGETCLLVFDCVSRVLYLDERFEDELAVMKDVYKSKSGQIRGVSTLGEIASSGMGFVDFYNKTIVASSIYN
ncbi:MAG: FIST signal transduction protein [Emticicia sp.]